MTKALAIALTALLLLVCSTARAADEQLGRLFFTPQQRASLDAGRRISLVKKTVADKPAAPSGPSAVELNGIITRSDGERTVWVNGKPYHDRSPQGMRVRTDPRKPASAEVRVANTRAAAQLRVGQRLDTRSGAISDRLTPAPASASPGPQPPAQGSSAGATPTKAENAVTAADDERNSAAQMQDR
jgi:hypothetical protein